MTRLPPMIELRIAEAERLIGCARMLLDRPEEEIVVNYLDHAVDALRIVFKDAASSELSSSTGLNAPAMATAANHD